MKIAFFNYLPLEAGGGLAQFYAQTIADLRKLNSQIQADAVSLSADAARKYQSLYSVYFVRNERVRATGARPRHPVAQNIRELGKILSSYDVIYAKNDILDLTLLKLAFRNHRLPKTIIGFHTPIQYLKTPTIQSVAHNLLYSTPYYRFLLQQASGFHALNSFHEKKLQNVFPQIPVRKIYNSVNPKLFTVSKRQHFGSLKFLWIGRLTPDKGCGELIRLIEGQRRRPVEWTIIGDGAMRNEIDNLHKSCDNVSYFPTMQRNRLAEEYRTHDAYVSTSQWECLPYTVLESQYSGLPVIAYDIPGNSDIVEHGTTGFLVKTFTELENRLFAFKRSQFDKSVIRNHALSGFGKTDHTKELYSFIKKVHD